MTKVNHVLEDIDNYEQSLHASLAFIHIYRYDEDKKKIDPKVKFWIGKKVQPGDLTPDILIQLSVDLGIIAELKRSFPMNDKEGKDLWKEEFEQLKKYDKKFTGWETHDTKVANQDLVLLTCQKLSTKVVDYINKNNLKFNRYSKNFYVIQFNPAPGLKAAIFLQKSSGLKNGGHITDFKKITNERLRTGITIALDFLFQSGLSKVKFLDYKPNVVYLMSIMWDHIFGPIPNEEDWRDAREMGGRKIVKVPIKVDKIRETIIKNFTISKNGEVIKKEWIIEALENLVRLGLAKKDKGGEDDYIIKFRKKIKDEGEGLNNKHKIFADLLYKEGIQTKLSELTNSSA